MGKEAKQGILCVVWRVFLVCRTRGRPFVSVRQVFDSTLRSKTALWVALLEGEQEVESVSCGGTNMSIFLHGSAQRGIRKVFRSEFIFSWFFGGCQRTKGSMIMKLRLRRSRVLCCHRVVRSLRGRLLCHPNHGRRASARHFVLGLVCFA